MIHNRDRVLPDQRLLRYERAEIAHARAHVAMGELEPGAGEGVRKLVRILHEAPRDLLIFRVVPQREVRGQHGRHMLLRLIEGIRDRGSRTFRLPLFRTGRALGQFPFVAEQVPEEVVAPLRRRRGPGDFRAAGDGVGADTRAVLALPAETLILERAAFRVRPDQRRVAGAVGLAEGVAAGNQRHRLFVVHRHAEEGFADVPRRRDRVRIAVRPFRIDVNETHLHGAERLRELALAAIAFVAEPGAFGTPIELFRLPDVGAAAGETEGLEAHRLERDVAGEDHQVGPGDFPAVFLLDRPQQPARLVEIGVVGPAIQGREALLALRLRRRGRR